VRESIADFALLLRSHRSSDPSIPKSPVAVVNLRDDASPLRCSLSCDPVVAIVALPDNAKYEDELEFQRVYRSSDVRR